jgi:hypothetical protein
VRVEGSAQQVRGLSSAAFASLATAWGVMGGGGGGGRSAGYVGLGVRQGVVCEVEVGVGMQQRMAGHIGGTEPAPEGCTEAGKEMQMQELSGGV